MTTKLIELLQRELVGRSFPVPLEVRAASLEYNEQLETVKIKWRVATATDDAAFVVDATPGERQRYLVGETTLPVIAFDYNKKPMTSVQLLRKIIAEQVAADIVEYMVAGAVAIGPT